MMCDSDQTMPLSWDYYFLLLLIILREKKLNVADDLAIQK